MTTQIRDSYKGKDFICVSGGHVPKVALACAVQLPRNLALKLLGTYGLDEIEAKDLLQATADAASPEGLRNYEVESEAVAELLKPTRSETNE